MNDSTHTDYRNSPAAKKFVADAISQVTIPYDRIQRAYDAAVSRQRSHIDGVEWRFARRTTDAQSWCDVYRAAQTASNELFSLRLTGARSPIVSRQPWLIAELLACSHLTAVGFSGLLFVAPHNGRCDVFIVERAAELYKFVYGSAPLPPMQADDWLLYDPAVHVASRLATREAYIAQRRASFEVVP